MNGKELRRLVEKHERNGFFDAYQAANDIVMEDGFTEGILRTLEILAWAVKKYSIVRFGRRIEQKRGGVGFEIRATKNTL